MVGFTLFLGVVLLAINLAVLHYAQGAVRAAAEEGARAGAAAGEGVDGCRATAIATFDDVLGGSYGSDIGFDCVERNGAMVARATGGFTPWIALMPGVNVDLEVVVAKEPEP
ncbi:MAG: hypothetical protein AAFP84_07365 [Actinomycetota bacterium]